MNKRIYKIFSILIIVFIGFILDVKPVFAVSCEYKIISPLYYIKNNSFNFTDAHANEDIRLKYTVDGSKYTIKDDYGEFKDNKFNKTVTTNKKCPSYIRTYGGFYDKKIEVLDNEKFSSYQNSYLINPNPTKVAGQITYYNTVPMFLVKQDGQDVTSQFYYAVNSVLRTYNDYLDSTENKMKANCDVDDITKLVNNTRYGKTREDFKAYAKGDYNTTIKDSKDSHITESCWNARKDYILILNQAVAYENFATAAKIADIEPTASYKEVANHISRATYSYEDIKEKESAENNLDYFKENYCSMYCETIKCKDMESSAQTACINACTPSNDCTKALNNCSNITNQTIKETCMKANMSDYQEYDSIYNTKIKELEDKIEEINGKMYTSIKKIEKLVLDSIEYEITCEDVEKLHTAWMIMWISAPVILIVMGTVDYFRAVISSDQEKMNKVRKKFPKRFIALLILILTPLLISIIVTVLNIGETANAKLISCVVNGGD